MLPLVVRRFAHTCVGCGSKLVAPISNKYGGRPPAGDVTKPPSSRAAADARLSALTQQLSAEQHAALGDAAGDASCDAQIDSVQLAAQLYAQRLKRAVKSPVCRPCVQAREGTTNDVFVPLAVPKPSDNSRIFRVLDALTFPLGLPSVGGEHSTGEKPGEVPHGADDVYVINRCDLVVPHLSQLPRLREYLLPVFAARGVPPHRVVLTSAARAWNLPALGEQLAAAPRRNVFVGAPNAGKSRLVHALAGVDQRWGATTWPLPFATQRPLELRAMPQFRSRHLVDMPSEAAGSAALGLLLPSVLRKAGAGVRATSREGKYTLPVVRARTGQTVSVGGVVALELPRVDAERQVPVHVFVGVGGFAHTEFARPLAGVAKLREINASTAPHHLKMRAHDAAGLELHPQLTFALAPTPRQSVVVQGLGFLQPFVFGDLPPDYEATVWAPDNTAVGLRPEMRPHVHKHSR